MKNFFLSVCVVIVSCSSILGQSDDCNTNDCCGDGTYWSEADARCIVAFYGDMDVDGYIGTTDLLDFLSVFGTNGDDIGIELLYGCMDEFACNYNQSATIGSSNSCLYPEDYGWCNCNGDVDDACGNCGGDGSTCFQNCGDDAYFDGYNYATVQLGNDCWFAENCRYIPYYGSDDVSLTSTTDPHYYILGETNGSVWAPSLGDTPPQNYSDYGVLYNFAAISNSAVCPNGWHVSSESNWEELEMWLGMSPQEYLDADWRGSDEGEKLKDASWGNGTVTPVGFNGKPGGALAPLGGGMSFYGGGHWWVINGDVTATGQTRRHLNSGHTEIYKVNYYSYAGLSARCVKTKLGCVDSGACNYDNNAQVDDGSCLYYGASCDDGNPNTFLDLINNYCICAGELLGCTDNDSSTNGGVACNYDPTAQLDDGSCEYLTCAGCTDNDPSTNGGVACNYDPSATIDSPSICLYPNDFCDDGDPQTINTTYDSACNCTGGTQVFVCGDLVNFDNHDYSTVQIGSQCWFSENCRSLAYDFSIPNEGSSASSAKSYANGYYGVPNNSGGMNFNLQDAMLTSDYITYGALYNYPAVQAGNMCPSGWHVPTDTEWSSLEIALGAPTSVSSQVNFRNSPAKDMKSNSGLWPQTGMYAPTNNSGMGIEPGGLLIDYGPGLYYQHIGYEALFWTKGSWNVSGATRRLIHNDNRVERLINGYGHEVGASVRCIEN
jgi:uncharacterized protein (TIGR02145 family)